MKRLLHWLFPTKHEWVDRKAARMKATGRDEIRIKAAKVDKLYRTRRIFFR